MFKCKYCEKEFENKNQLGGHIVWCKENPNRSGKCNFNNKNNNFNKLTDNLFCRYCGKSCKNLNSLKQHEIRCKENPNRIISPICQKGHKSWNKGLTKETDDRVKHNGESISNMYKTGKITNWCNGLTKENDERLLKMSNKISNTVLDNVKNDNWHNSFSKSKIVEYNGIKFHGSWEVAFAKYLDSKSITWIRPLDKFEYIFENKTHYYTPDFYLPKYNLYIEIKGYPVEKDFIKWDFCKSKLDIYFGDDLVKYNIIESCKDVYENIPQKYRNKIFNVFEYTNTQ